MSTDFVSIAAVKAYKPLFSDQIFAVIADERPEHLLSTWGF